MSLLHLTRSLHARLLLKTVVPAKHAFYATTPHHALISRRGYAKKAQSTAELIPGSKMPITDPAAREEYSKAQEKMKNAVEWFRKECTAIETRASGRVTPAVLSPVRVKLGGSEETYRLEDLATVGVKDGSMLLLTLFDESNMTQVESAIYAAKLPGITPQKHDSRTIRVPVAKPTVEARLQLYTSALRQAEDLRVQIRRIHQTSVKKGKYEKRSVELEEFQKLHDRFMSEIDKLVAPFKQTKGK